MNNILRTRKVEPMLVKQGRIYADSPDQAAVEVRKKFDEFQGKLNMKKTYIDGWYEYLIVLKGDKNGQSN